MDILLSEENGLVDLQQGVGRLVNAIVAVLGPELAPGSIFFSRCKACFLIFIIFDPPSSFISSICFLWFVLIKMWIPLF